MVRRRNYAAVLAIGPIDGVEHDRAVFDAPTDGTELVHRPRKRHCAGAWYSAKRRAEPGCSATCRRRRDRPQRLAADREADEPSGRCRCGTGRRSAGSLIDLPRIFRGSAEPDIALRELAQRQLRDENRTGIIETLDDRCVGVDHLLPERARTPCGLVAA